jgi:arylsulfatase A-like enzyme
VSTARSAASAREPGRRAVARGLAPAVVTLALALLVFPLPGCSEPSGPPNVLIITLDTCRADRLGAYGYDERDCTPVLDALAEESVVFEQSFAASSFTPPSHASLFTGLYPSEHGLTYWNRKLADVPTAAELFAAAGYRTFAVSPLKTLFLVGLDRGFGTTVELPFVAEPGRILLGDAEAINAEALASLTPSGDAAEQPFFAWLHYYDAHRVFGRQGEDWARRYADPDMPLAVGDTEDWYQLPPTRRPDRAKSQQDVTPEQARFIEDRYDGGLAYLDAQLGVLFDGLREAGVLDDTIVVVTADHGEVLTEHEAEWFAHDPHLVDENIRVPLVIRMPDGRHGGRRVSALSSGVDVLPTVLELAGLPAPGLSHSGMDLSHLVRGDVGPRREVVYAERQAKDRTGERGVSDAQAARDRDASRMVRTATHKLVHHEDRGTFALYDVGDETTDLWTSQPDQAAALVARYRAERARLQSADGSSSALDPEAEALLKELGYFGTEDGGH